MPTIFFVLNREPVARNHEGENWQSNALNLIFYEGLKTQQHFIRHLVIFFKDHEELKEWILSLVHSEALVEPYFIAMKERGWMDRWSGNKIGIFRSEFVAQLK